MSIKGLNSYLKEIMKYEKLYTQSVRCSTKVLMKHELDEIFSFVMTRSVRGVCYTTGLPNEYISIKQNCKEME